MVNEKGPWLVTKWPKDRLVLQSDDFTHDVVLEISGDFKDAEQRIEYAKEIARRLNTFNGA